MKEITDAVKAGMSTRESWDAPSVSNGAIRDRLTLGPWRRRRRMHRLLRELDRLDAGRLPRRRGRGALGRKLTAGLVAIGLAFTLALIFADKQLGLAVSMDGIHRKVPLGTPPDGTPGVGTFKFLLTQPMSHTRPVAYDPCRPIEYEVNDALEPPDGGRILDDAIGEIEQATGLQFQYVGASDRLPAPDNDQDQARREPVIIGWTTPEAVSDLEGRVAGVGGSSARGDQVTLELEYVTGLVALDAPQLAGVLKRAHGEAQVRAIVMHELGHLVGLDHVDDPNELMHSENIGRLTFGPGDREGLIALGSGNCF